MKTHKEVQDELNRYDEEVIKPLMGKPSTGDLEVILKKAEAIGYSNAMMWVLNKKPNE